MIKIQIGGSPCTYWSIARAATNSPITRETINEGLGWDLFWNYLVALQKFQPDIWLYENVASMSKEIKSSISAHLGRDPHQINGSLVSAAERDRFYWTNIEGVEPPAEQGIVLHDILENDVPERYFYNYPLERIDMSKQVCAYMVCKNHEMHKRVFNPAFKIHTLTAVGGGGQHKKVLDNGRARKLTPTECERCMTLPDGYTAGVADGHRYKALGNGWTADVIIHILSYALKDVPRDEEIVVLSMYDGIATGRYCLDKMGFHNVTYYAFEIDPKVVEIAKKNYPDIIHLGDAFDVRNEGWSLYYGEEKKEMEKTTKQETVNTVELIKVTQLPIIEERLRAAKEYVDKTVANAMSLICTEETVLTVKATRADLNRQFAELEEQRKAVKAAVLDPYNTFEAVYRECVSNAFKRADADLKQKINDVEGEMKRRCEEGLRDYFAELCAAHHIDFVTYERAGIIVSMADAKSKTQPPKKLRDQLTEFVEGIAKEVEAISKMENADEIMADFMVTLNAMEAIGIVQERHRRIEAEKAARAAREEAKAREAEAVKKVEAFAPPIEEKAPPAPPTAQKLARVTFTVTDTIDRLKQLKQFLVSNGYKYE